MGRVKKDNLKGVDIFAEEILVNKGESKLPASQRAAVLIRAQQMRELEKILDREAVATYQKLMNKCPFWTRLALALDLVLGKMGQMKINKPQPKTAEVVPS